MPQARAVDYWAVSPAHDCWRSVANFSPASASRLSPRHRLPSESALGGQAMSRFWKPGSEKPSTLLVDDEEGGVVFLPSSNSSASSSGCASKP